MNATVYQGTLLTLIHVSDICIGKIHHLLTQSITEKLVHAFITARDNIILYGLPKRLILHLQHGDRLQSLGFLLHVVTPYYVGPRTVRV